MLTFDQGSKELHAQDRLIAGAIKSQSDSGDIFAKHIIDTYTAGTGNLAAGTAPSIDAQTAFSKAYEAWRATNWPTLVAPVATQLGHPGPGLSAEGTTSAESTSLFATPVASTDPAPIAGPVPAGVTMPTSAIPTSATPDSDGGRRKRVSWSQGDVVALTKMLLPLEAQQHPAAFLAFSAANPKFPPETVHEKAVELELTTVPLVTTTPATPQKPKLTREDEANLLATITDWVAPDGMEKEYRLLCLEFAAKAIREFIKQINA